MISVGSSGDPLRLTRCMRCGYSLAHLPTEGICPECGLAYDQSIIVFYGERRSFNPIFDPLGSRWGVLLCLLFGAMKGWQGWTQLRRGDWVGGVQLAGCIAIFGMMLGWRFLGRREGGGNILQCRFNSFGCLQCALPGEMTGLADPHWVAGRIWIAMIGLLLLVGIAGMPWRAAVGFLVVLVIGAAIGWRIRVVLRRRRPQPAAPPTSQALVRAAPQDWWSSGPTPWRSVRGVSIQPVKSRPGRYRLIFYGGPGRWDPVDAEVDCTGEQATALWTRVCAWRAAVGTPFDAAPASGAARRAAQPHRM